MNTEFVNSIKKHGYIGDQRPALLAYLTLVSALTEKPVSSLLKASSGVGKSHALKTALRYVPEDAYEMLSGMSEKAIAYMGDTYDLRHKTLVIQEAAGFTSGVGRAYLRQLITEGRIDYATVEKTTAGLGLKKLSSVEGPVGVMMTTTANALHHEDESRFLSYALDESPARLAEILIAKASGGSSEPDAEEIKPFHDAYRALREDTPEVGIPFLGDVARALPTHAHRIARDFDHVISLIRTVALLNRCERDTDSEGRIIATLEDYAVVRDLLEEQLTYGLSVSTREEVRAVIAAVTELTGDPFNGSTYSQAQLVEHLGRDKGYVSRGVTAAVAEGYLINDNPGQGRTAELSLGQTKLREGRVLPTVEELAEPSAAQVKVGEGVSAPSS